MSIQKVKFSNNYVDVGQLSVQGLYRWLRHVVEQTSLGERRVPEAATVPGPQTIYPF